MKKVILVLTLLAFMIGTWGQIADAAMSDFACAQHEKCTMDQADPLSNTSEKNKTDMQSCPDCGCHHTHVMAKAPVQSESVFNLASHVRFVMYDAPPTHAASPLYRPPII